MPYWNYVEKRLTVGSECLNPQELLIASQEGAKAPPCLTHYPLFTLMRSCILTFGVSLRDKDYSKAFHD